jgi:valyl-tRNA synthetase
MKYLSNTIDLATRGFVKNDYAQALEAVEKCFWNFCDNYLEIVKGRAYNSNDNSAVCSLMLTFDIFVKLFAPFCPFIAEETYQACKWKKKKSVHLESWPKTEDVLKAASDNVELYEALVVLSSEIRKQKTTDNVSLRAPVLELVVCASDIVIDKLRAAQVDIDNVGNVQSNACVYQTGKELLVEKVVLGELLNT